MPGYTQAQFDAYLRRNPYAYPLFEQRALVLHSEKPTGASHWQIVADMRKLDRGKLPKGVPNGAIAHLARKFVKKHPDKRGLFTLRALKETVQSITHSITVEVNPGDVIEIRVT